MKSEYMLWVDLETTGLSVHTDDIVEVACILTKTYGPPISGQMPLLALETLWEYQAVPQPTPEIWAKLTRNKFVHQMHLHSGLVQNMTEATETLHYIDWTIGDKLQDLNVKKGEITLAGSGVSHFDIHFLRRLMPATMHYLNWKMLDVGQLEEWRELAGMQTFDEAFPEKVAEKNHRAADDINHALNEAKWYLGLP